MFLVAILTPCLVLIGLSLRTLEQERQLEEKRSADERQLRATQLRQELSNRLERVRLNLTLSATVTPDELIAFAGSVRAGQLVLPWDESAEIRAFRHAIGQSDFLRQLRQGEQEEAGGSVERAVKAYRQAVKRAGHPAAQAFARLSLARSLMKAGRKEESVGQWTSILSSSPKLMDENGIPLALYAAPPLLAAGVGKNELLKLIRTMEETPEWWSPAALYMSGDLARGAGAPDLDSKLTEQAHDRDQAEALQRDFPSLMTAGRGSKPSWVPYGDPPWLVGVVAHGPSPESRVIAVRLCELLARTDSYVNGVRLASDPSGEPLGDPFSGIRVTIPVSRESNASFRLAPFVLALAIALAVTLFAGYLAWRDVHRELRLAAMRSQFVASVSHELKTPLTAIRMFAEAMRMDEGLGRLTVNQNLDTIVQEADRLSRLVNNVLDFARIEQGKKIYPMQLTSLADIVESAAGAMEYTMAQSGFRLTVVVDHNLPPILADRDAIQQAILNLLDNAMKYSGDSRDIELRLSREKDYGVVSIVDKGLGIPEAEQSRIFERFYRIPSAENDRLPGTGLGLTLVDHVVRVHGGSVGVESQPGQGSAFTIRLPLRSET
jgi:signal transduction histidine kinase